MSLWFQKGVIAGFVISGINPWKTFCLNNDNSYLL